MGARPRALARDLVRRVRGADAVRPLPPRPTVPPLSAHTSVARNPSAFFLSSKLAELPPQPYSPSTFLLLPTPSRAPLSAAILLSLLLALTPTTLTPTVVVPSPTGLPTPTPVPVKFEPTGLLLYLKSAHYESGTSALSGWVPLEVEDGKEGREGVGRLRALVDRWSLQGGSSADEPRVVEMEL